MSNEPPIREEFSQEKNSTKKIVFYLSDTKDTDKAGGYLGEFTVLKGQLNVHASNEQEQNVLMSALRDAWMPQLGFPVLKKENDTFARNEGGKLVIEKYILPAKAPDEFLDAVYDYIRALGVFKVELISLN